MAVGIWSDMLYPAYQQQQIHDAVWRNGVASEYVEIDSPHGHDAFLINSDQIAEPLERFLGDVSEVRRLDRASHRARGPRSRDLAIVRASRIVGRTHRRRSGRRRTGRHRRVRRRR